MRELKFRVWIGDSEENPKPRMRTVEFYDKYLFDKVPTMQFIGYKDKNGKDIYEGDIVLAYIGTFDGYKKYIVKIDYPICSPLNINSKEHPPEVIGNIHENPELLEGLQ